MIALTPDVTFDNLTVIGEVGFEGSAIHFLDVDRIEILNSLFQVSSSVGDTGLFSFSVFQVLQISACFI